VNSKPAIFCEQVSVEYTSPTYASMSIKESLIRSIRGTKSESRFFRALKDVNLSIQPGETLAFIGPNGCGKSTLLKVIAGVITPQYGRVTTEGIIAPLIELGAGFDQELTGVENIWLSCRLMGASKELIKNRLAEIVDFAELGEFIHAPVKTYSSGMYMRLAFACSTIISPEILLVDEILAVGDAKFQRKCIERIQAIRASGNTIVIVSHDRGIIEGLCSRAIFLWHGQMLFDGNPRTAFEIYDELSKSTHLHDNPQHVVDECLRRDKMINSSPKALDASVISGLEVTGGPVSKSGRTAIEINCSFDILRDLSEPVVAGFQIRKGIAARAFGTNSKVCATAESLEALRKKGRKSVKWTYDAGDLASGSYVVDVCLSNSDITQIYQFDSNVLQFNLMHAADLLNHDGNLVELVCKEFSAL